MSMNIIFAHGKESASDTSKWLERFSQSLPDATFHHWSRGGPGVGAEVAIVWNPPPDLLRQEPGIKIIFNLGAGVDALFRLDGLHEGIQLVRIEDGGMAVQMAEYAAYALLRASRQFDAYEERQRAGKWECLPDIRRSDWPVGVMGQGVMGARVAQVLAGLDYPVAAWSRGGKAMEHVEVYAGPAQLPAFLARTRVLVNTLPLTDETRNILCRDTLGRLLPGAYLVNIARGEHLVEEDLLALLDTGHLHGATLDVFRTEPLPADHPFWRHPRITVTPHVAAASLLDETVEQVSGKIRQYQQGEPLSGVVVWNRGY
nr:glyoxylate/hydroxypyruvate reductase A [Paracandidimonas lactea]